MNNVSLIGRLTKEPELKYTASGMSICKFTLAVKRDFVKDAEQKADFINCVSFNKTAENLANYQTKGNQIAVIGRIQTGSYENSEGKKVFTTDIMVDRIDFLEKKNSNESNSNNSNTKNSLPITDDDLPF